MIPNILSDSGRSDKVSWFRLWLLQCREIIETYKVVIFGPFYTSSRQDSLRLNLLEINNVSARSCFRSLQKVKKLFGVKLKGVCVC